MYELKSRQVSQSFYVIIKARLRKTGTLQVNSNAIASEVTAPALVSDRSNDKGVGQQISDEPLLATPTYESPNMHTPRRKSQSAKGIQFHQH
ncbi:hypothetical protein PR048_021345 [Dryococelus australis]|uniref:Uncharacterized protein n=1 Tax=Dryococelus australis TaxID=614101 RepID=A0ABQ9GY03_9NEOP|nr:hypothetical protein PR048_021345 [Dryococelus australis]